MTYDSWKTTDPTDPEPTEPERDEWADYLTRCEACGWPGEAELCSWCEERAA